MHSGKSATPVSGIRSLSYTQLARRTDPQQFPFDDTAAVTPSSAIIGQDRAVEAIRLGLGIRQHGFNVFAVGTPGSGRRSIALRVLEAASEKVGAPDGWCYVARFDDDERPKAIRLPAGTARKFKSDLDKLVDRLLKALPEAFETVEYTTARSTLDSKLDDRSRDAYDAVRAEAAERGLAMLNGSDGVQFVPAENGRPREHAYDGMPDDERLELESLASELRTDVDLAARLSRAAVREVRQEMDALTKRTAQEQVDRVLAPLIKRYAAHEDAVAHLRAVGADILDNLEHFLPEEDLEAGLVSSSNPSDIEYWRQERRKRLDRYRANVLTDHDAGGHAPVVYEPHPTLGNLIGRVEQRQQFGALSTDFSMIRAGALHRANGGYLVLEAADVLREPYSWDALKRALRTREIRLGSAADDGSGPFTTVTLQPDPIPLDVKVVLVGDTDLYHTLYETDTEMPELFKVQAEFGESMARTPESERQYADFLAALCIENTLRPIRRDAVAKVVEVGARLAGDGWRLTTRFAAIADIVREADYWAAEDGAAAVSAAHVAQALASRIRRVDLTQELIGESFARNVVLLTTEGSAIGQVNGVTVLGIGDYDFGVPLRITARVRQGSGEVLDIEREVELGGPLHSKGVLILVGCLGSRYLSDDQLAFSATLTFEQSASEVDGDSASAAEYFALLSALAEIPLRQGIAVTGSLNQAGEIQPVGAVNEKIEGFFDVCRQRGLSGEHGVMIPAGNVQHLMLRDDVVEAVREGKFHVYAIGTVDDGLEVLSGLPAGVRDESGEYPAGSFNRAVEDRLRRMAERRREIAADDDEAG